ncbi:MAG: hypothetical protein AAGA48_40865 [Myxococcota bacterium]
MRRWPMVSANWNGRWDTVGRNVAALVCTMPVAILTTVVLCRVLPLAEDLSLTIGMLVLPLIWATVAWLVYLVPNAFRAWTVVLGALAVLSLTAWGLGPVP